MNWSDKTPTEPGFYLLSEVDETLFIVEVDVESDSHGMFFVRLPDDDHKYPFEIWPDACPWCLSLQEGDKGM